MTDLWSGRLSEYLDGDLPAEEVASLEAHLAACAGCRGELGSLRRVMSRLDAAPDREPPADLWPGLKQRIEIAGRPEGAAPTVRAFPRAERRPWAGWRLLVPSAAAALLLASLWWWREEGAGPPRGSAAMESTTLPSDGAALHQVAGRYGRAASALDVHLAGRDLPPDVAKVLEAEMAVFDRAITETRRALAEAPGDPDLRAHLTATLRAKVRFLERIEGFAGEAS